MNIFSQLISAQLEVRSADPTTGLAPGRIYFNTVTACPRFYDGTRWVQETAPGIVQEYYGDTAAPGWIMLTGSTDTLQMVSKTTYPTLFAAVGYKFGGSGDSFALPPRNGRVALGAGSGTGITGRTVGATGGEETHTLSQAEMPSHVHGVNDPSHTHPISNYTSGYPVGTGAGAYNNNPGAPENTTNTQSNTTGITIQNTGGGTAHNNMQPYVVANFIIKI